MAGRRAGLRPSQDFARARLVVFAGDHGLGDAGVSALPPGATAAMVAELLAGAAPANVLAEIAGVGVRVVDVCVDGDTAVTTAAKIGTGGGRSDRGEALSAEDTARALEFGAAVADEEIDAGADLLIAGDVGLGATTIAATLISIITNTEPTKVVGRGSGIDDAGWMRKVVVIRDGRRRAYADRQDPLALLSQVGGAQLAAITGFLLRACARRTPVLLDGVVVCAAAMLAREALPRTIRWWQAAHVTTEPAHELALERLRLEPILDLDVNLGQGAGALLAVPVLRAAARTLSMLEPVENPAPVEPVEPVEPAASTESDHTDPG